MFNTLRVRGFKSSAQRRRLQFGVAESQYLFRFGDLLATVVAVFVALLLWFWIGPKTSQEPLAFIQQKQYWFFVLPGLWLLLANINGFYDPQLVGSRAGALVRLMLVTVESFVIYLIIYFLFPRDALPRLFILQYSIVAFAFITLWRFFLQPALLTWTSEPRRILIICTGCDIKGFVQVVREYARSQYDIVGVVGFKHTEDQSIEGVPVLSHKTSLSGFVKNNAITQLVVANPHNLPQDQLQEIMTCHLQGISITPLTKFYEQLTGRVPIEHLGDEWDLILPVEQSSMFNPYPLIHRLIDITLSLIGLAFFAMILPLLALIIYLDSPGPIFFRQERIGKTGRPFGVVKLRSMITNAEAKTGARFATKNDSRITRVGRFLRKSRLDEVPQLWNVLRGEMSIIGPRPERPEFLEGLTEKIPFYQARLAVKPGLTGWAQVNYDYAGEETIGHLRKLQYDLYYIRHQSLTLDIQIIMRTIITVLTLAGQ